MEYLEIWDWERAAATGKSVERKQSHREGIPHEGVHLWLFRVVDTHPELILQRRALSKDLYPGYLDISVGGHVPFGYDGDKLQKEAGEELGLSLQEKVPVDLGYFRYEEIIPEMDLFHREFQHVWVLREDQPLSAYRFNDGEVDSVCALRLDLFEMMLGSAIGEAAVDFYDGLSVEKKTITTEALHPLFFTPPMKPYLATVFAAIHDLSSGRKAHRFELI